MTRQRLETLLEEISAVVRRGKDLGTRPCAAEKVVAVGNDLYVRLPGDRWGRRKAVGSRRQPIWAIWDHQSHRDGLFRLTIDRWRLDLVEALHRLGLLTDEHLEAYTEVFRKAQETEGVRNNVNWVAEMAAEHGLKLVPRSPRVERSLRAVGVPMHGEEGDCQVKLARGSGTKVRRRARQKRERRKQTV